MAGGDLDLSRTATALKPLASGRGGGARCHAYYTQDNSRRCTQLSQNFIAKLSKL